MGLGGQRHALAALPPGKTRYPTYRRLGGLRGRSWRFRKIRPPPGFDPRNVQPAASRYTDWAIPAQVSVFSQANLAHSLLPYALQFHWSVCLSVTSQTNFNSTSDLIPLLFLTKILKPLCFSPPSCVLYFSPIVSSFISLPAHTWERLNKLCTVTSTKIFYVILTVHRR